MLDNITLVSRRVPLGECQAYLLNAKPLTRTYVNKPTKAAGIFCFFLIRILLSGEQMIIDIELIIERYKTQSEESASVRSDVEFPPNVHGKEAVIIWPLVTFTMNQRNKSDS